MRRAVNAKGSHPIHGTGQGISEQGRKVVVEGDLVMCPCKKNRVLRGSNPGIFLHSDAGAAIAARASIADTASPVPVATTFDERVRAAAQRASLEGYPYYIETGDGRIYSGCLAADGKLPRIDTGASADDYTVYWGDEALAKQDGA